jgi:hypothetical protein
MKHAVNTEARTKAVEALVAAKSAEGYDIGEIEYWGTSVYIHAASPVRDMSLCGENTVRLMGFRDVKRRAEFIAWLREGFDGKISENRAMGTLTAAWVVDRVQRRKKCLIRLSNHPPTPWRAAMEVTENYSYNESGEIQQQ